MVKGKIALYRQKLDQTLASGDLTDDEKLKSLVQDHILRSSDDKSREITETVIKKRTAEVSNLLDMLRSASENYDASLDKAQHASWKLKQDNEEFRVMYREGPVGSPFHSLLVEGYIDAPLDVCLCVSCETALYPRWFPDIRIPTFKIVVAKSLQKIRVGEEISLLRTKLSWPLSSREVVLHVFEFEYLEDDLIVVLLNTISDVANIKMETHGFTNEGIPDAGNTVRIDLVGGFALQKVTENRSYFRTIGNMDIKLDFVPPSLINFVSRQLIGTGFRFYQQIVASIAKGDEDFGKALKDPLYARIREAVFSSSKSKRHLETQTNGEEQPVSSQDASTKDDLKVVAIANGHANGWSHRDEPTGNEIEEDITETADVKCETVSGLGNMFRAEDQKTIGNGYVNGYPIQYTPATEIEEEEVEGIKNTADSCNVNDVVDRKEDIVSTDHIRLQHLLKKVQISPEVEQALGTLDKMISVVRDGKLKGQGLDHFSPEIEGDKIKELAVEKHVKLEDKLGISTEHEISRAVAHPPKNDIVVGVLRSTDSESQPQAGSQKSTSPGEYAPVTNSAESSPAFVSPMTVEANGIHENSPMENQKTKHRKKWRLCCLHLLSGRMVA